MGIGDRYLHSNQPMQSISPHQITIKQLKDIFSLHFTDNPDFFPECDLADGRITAEEKARLKRVKNNFLFLMEEPPILENTVKMVILSPLLDLANFYRPPFRIDTETSLEITTEDEGVIIQGRIDVLVIKNRLWLLVIESKRSDFSVTRAIPQALAYMLVNPRRDRSTFALITNGSEFLFLKSVFFDQITYGTSRLFSLYNPDNDLDRVLPILQQLGTAIAMAEE
jgi:Type I restriction enzyme R protein N terminus (HSDR_N)